MSEEGGKPSGLRPPSKIARPCSNPTPKPALPHIPKTNASVILTEDTDSFIIGDRVWVGGTKPGHISYIGETQFAPGDWAGVVLDEPIGKNDGSVGNVRYFQCESKKGVFSRLSRLSRAALGPGGAPASPPASPRGTPAPPAASPLTSPTTPTPGSANGDVKVGDRVIVMSSQGSKAGILRYKGTTNFAPGEWCGVELDDPLGKNDGSVEGVRYFECEPKYGLFSPSHKVSKSPSPGRRPSCQIHHGSTVKRHNSKESINSLASSVRTNATPTSYRKPSTRQVPTTPTGIPKTPVQDLLKEKQEQINELLKERDLIRDKMIKAAEQVDHAEKKLFSVTVDYDKYRIEAQEKILASDKLIEKLKVEKEELASQLEDVQFRAEEETIIKSDFEVMNEENVKRIKELEHMMMEERKVIETLNSEVERLNNSEEMLRNTREELRKLQSQRDGNESEMKEKLNNAVDKLRTLEEANNVLHQNLNENLCQNERQISELTIKFKEEISKLNVILEEIGTEKEQLHSQIISLDSEICSRKAHIEKCEERNKQLMTEICGLREKIEEYEALDNQNKSKILSLVKGFEEFKACQSKESKDINEQFENKIHSLTKQLQDKENVCEQSEEIITKLRKELEESTNGLKITLDDIGKKHVNEIENLKKALDDCKQNLSNKEKELSEEKIKFDETEKEFSSLQKDLRQMKIDLDEKSKLVSDKENEIMQIKAALNETINVKLKLEESYTKDVEEQKQKYDEVNELLHKVREDLIQSGKVTESKEIDFKNQLLEISRKLEQKELENNLLKNNLDENKSKLDDQNKIILDMEMELKNTRDILGELKVDLDQKNMFTKNLEEEKRSLIIKSQAGMEAEKLLEEKIQKLELELGDNQRRLQVFEERCSELVHHKEKLEADIAELINTSSDSSSQLSKLNADLREKEKKIEQMNLTLSDKIRESENKEQEFKQQLSTLKQENEKLVAKLQLEIKSALDHEKMLETKLNEKLKKIEEELREMLKFKENSLKQEELLNNSIREKENALCELNLNLEHSAKDISELRTQLQELKGILNEKEILCNDNGRLIESLSNEKVKLAQELSSISAEKNSLESKFLEKEQELSNTLKVMQERNLEVKHFQERLSSAEGKDSEIICLQTKIEEITKLYDSKLTEVDLKNKNLEQSLQDGLKETEIKKGEMEKLNEEIQSLKTKSLEEEVKISKLTENVNRITFEKEETNKQLCLAQEKCAEYLSTIEKLENNHSVLADSVNVTSEVVTKLNKELKEKDELLCAVKDDYSLKEKKFEENEKQLKVEIDSMKQECENLHKIYDEKIKKLLDNEKEMRTNYAQENSKLQDNLRVAYKEKEKIEAALNEKTREYDEVRINLEKSLSSIQDVNKFDTEQINSLEKTIKTVEGEKQKAELKIKSQEEKLKTLEEDLSLKCKELVAVNESKLVSDKKLKEDEVTYTKLKDEYASAKKQLLDQENESTKKVEILKKEMIHLNLQIDVLEKKCKEKDMSLTTISTELQNLKKVKTVENNVTPSGDTTGNEIELKQSEINFLNSVICDLQNKNDELKAKINSLELFQSGSSGQNGVKKTKVITPRLFCDICEVFDLHDTEDCPRQATDSPPPVQRNHSYPRGSAVSRPYCEICEMFGHDSADCDDDQTF